MEESILDTIKKMLGILSADTAFDEDIVNHINSAFVVLNQVSPGSPTIFSIVDNSAKWVDFTADITVYNNVKTYIYLFVRELFDPPASGIVMGSVQRKISELEWRLSIQEPPQT